MSGLILLLFESILSISILFHCLSFIIMRKWALVKASGPWEFGSALVCVSSTGSSWLTVAQDLLPSALSFRQSIEVWSLNCHGELISSSLRLSSFCVYSDILWIRTHEGCFSSLGEFIITNCRLPFHNYHSRNSSLSPESSQSAISTTYTMSKLWQARLSLRIKGYSKDLPGEPEDCRHLTCRVVQTQHFSFQSKQDMRWCLQIVQANTSTGREYTGVVSYHLWAHETSQEYSSQTFAFPKRCCGHAREILSRRPPRASPHILHSVPSVVHSFSTQPLTHLQLSSELYEIPFPPSLLVPAVYIYIRFPIGP